MTTEKTSDGTMFMVVGMKSAIRNGLADGWQLGDPHRELSSGWSYDDNRIDELYGSCVNLGASLKQTVTNAMICLRSS